jgi:hypothetical protein
MTVPPASGPEFQTAPPAKRADPSRIAVRLYNGALIAHVEQELADRLVMTGNAEACRRGPRRYLRLRRGICMPCTEPGWDIIDFVRKWHGDKWAAEYIANKDQQSERLRYQPP